MFTKSLSIALLLGGTLSLQPVIGAERPKATGGDPSRQRMIELADEMKLSEDQRTQMRDLFEAQAEKFKAIRADANLSPEEKMQKIKAIQEEMEPQVKKLLNAEQFVIWQDAREKMFAAGAGSSPGDRMRERLQEAMADLNLTDDQKAKLKEVFAGQGEKLKELRANTSLSPEEKMREFRAMQEKMDPEVKAILTSEQFAKWQEKREKMRAQFQKFGKKQ